VGYSNEHGHLLSDKTAFRVAAVLLLVAAAILIRLYGTVWKPSFDFNEANAKAYQDSGFWGKHTKQLRHTVEVSPTRSYHSAITARYFYYQNLKTAVPWEKDVLNAQILQGVQPLAEDYCPPVMERLVAFIFGAAGAELGWMPPVLSVLIWISGGGLMFMICRRFGGFEAGYISSAVFMLLPFGIYSSRIFLPDSLWLVSMLPVFLTMLRYFEKQNQPRLIALVLASAVAAFIKPLNMLFVFAAYFSLALAHQDKKIRLFDLRSWLFYIAVIMPPAFYYIYVKTSSAPVVKTYFIWELLTTKFFYNEMWFFFKEAVSWPVMLMAAAGVLMFKKRDVRYFAASMWIMFVIAGIAFNHSINTFHDYYVLYMVPIIALSLGLLTDSAVRLLRQWRINRLFQIGICGVLIIFSLYTLRPVRWMIQKNDLSQRNVLSRQIGEAVNHSTKAVFLAPSFGKPLMYDAWISGKTWPSAWLLWKKWKEQKAGDEMLTDTDTYLKNHPMSEGEAENIFKSEYSSMQPEFFIVTDFEQFQQQPGLKEFLEKNYHQLANHQTYLIFDLKRRN